MAAPDTNLLTQWTLRWLRFSLRWPRMVTAVILALTLALAWGSGNIVVSGDYRAFFDADNPDLMAFDAIEESYAKLDAVALVVRFETGDLFTPDRLAYLADLTDRLWRTPAATRVDSIANHQHSWAEGDDLMVADLVPVGQTFSTGEAARIRDIALGEPALNGYLVSADGATASVVVTLHAAPGDVDAPATAVRFVRDLAAQDMAANASLRIAVVGGATLDLALREVSERDARVLAPIMIGVLLVGLWVFFRGWRPAAVVVAIVFASIAATLGVMGYAQIPLMTATAAVPVIVLAIAVADAIHLIAAAQSGLARGGALAEAIADSLRLNLKPVLITTATTVIGFLSLNFAAAPPYRDVGNLAAVGSVFALFYTVAALPPLLVLLPPPAAFVRSGGGDGYRRLAKILQRHASLAIFGFIVLLGAAVYVLPRLQVNDKFVDYFAPDVTFRQDAEFATRYLPGLYALEFSLPSGEDGGIAEPAYLARVASFAEWLRQQPGVTHVVSVVDMMKRLNRNMHGDDPAYDRLPESRMLAAQYLLLYEMSLPFGRDLNNQIDVAKSATRLTAIMGDISTAEMQRLEARAEGWLRDHAPPQLAADGTGVAIIFAHLTERTVSSMITGAMLSIVAIALCLYAALRSWPLAFLSLIVNIVPVELTLGLWSATKGEVGLYVAAAVAVALGLIVDFAIHILSKYRVFRDQGATVTVAMEHALEMVGPALMVSALALIAGFAVLLAADFSLNANLGIMTAIIVAAALVTDLILLPALIFAAARKR